MIRCPECREEINENDVITLDFMNTIRHLGCLGLPQDYIEDIDYFEEMKKKYAFLK